MRWWCGGVGREEAAGEMVMRRGDGEEPAGERVGGRCDSQAIGYAAAVDTESPSLLKDVIGYAVTVKPFRRWPV